MVGQFDKRCFHFDRSGKALDPPCPKGTDCRFAHPGDKRWDELGPTRRPREYNFNKYENYSRYYDETAPPPASRKKPDPSPPRRPSTRQYEAPVPTVASPKQVTPNPPLSATDTMAPPPTPKPRPTSASAMPPPPPPSAPPAPPAGPLPPIPPAPALPAALAAATTRQIIEVNQEQNAAAWQERVDLLAKIVDLRSLATKTEAEIQQLNQLNQRARAHFVPSPIDEAKFQNRIKDLQAKQEELGKQMKKCIDQLQSSKSWATIPPHDADDLVIRVREALRATQEMASTTGKMESLLGEIGLDHKDPDAMDVDAPDPSRPSKRRRLSVDIGKVAGPSEDDLQEVREKLANIELRISNFENDINARDEELAGEVNDKLELRFEELLSERLEELNMRDNGISSQMKDVQREAHGVETGVNDLAGEIEDLLKRAEASDKEIAALRKENQEFSGLVAGWDQKLQQYMQNRDQDRETIAALQATLHAYMQRPISPPASPRIPTRDELVKAVREPIIDQLREAVKPLLENYRAEIQVMQHKHGQDVYSNVSQKIDATARIINAVSSIIQPPNPNP
ncbi:hypothetical protein BDN72DRAFT_235565 [Pluteus cervinus]|uniref:Uncharacterized protein n=1 Tax=Pluteus cervinus TaxID=181527 RepID=A0ACD3BF33_9AGAR|nr:hypothetical protein BDN72DRAFT_235565 [Pluteus cervinus]